MNSRTIDGADSLQSIGQKVSDGLGSVAHDASDRLKDLGSVKLESAKARLAQAQADVAEGASLYADKTGSYVRSNPWKALGMAAAGGAIIGMLVSRR